MLSKKFKPGKCKTSLKLAVARIKLLKNKRDAQVKLMRRDLAQLLEAGQDQTARIRVEHVIREEKTMSAYDLIELYCELIVARLTIIESQKSCPIDLKEAICSVIFASPRCADLPELQDICKHFSAKYGKEFTTSALELRPDCGVSLLITEKLSARAPDIATKIKVLTAIAEEHNIKWEPKAFEEQLQTPSQDLLKGSSSFMDKIPVEPSTTKFPPPSAEKHKTGASTESDLRRSSVGSSSISSHAFVVTTPQPRSKLSASTYNKDERGYTYAKEEFTTSNKENWTMEFKDATSAAQAAAESAERASMAARAAAELSSRGNDAAYSDKSHELSNSMYKHGAGDLGDPKFQDGHFNQDSARSAHNINETTNVAEQQVQRNVESPKVPEYIAGDLKSGNKDSKASRNQHGRKVSSYSSSEEEAMEANWQHKEVLGDASSGKEFSERRSTRSVSHSADYSHDGDVSVSDFQKSDRYKSEGLLREDLNNRSMNEVFDHFDYGKRKIERKSSKSLSSRSADSSIDHEMVRDSPVRKNHASQHYPFGSRKEADQDEHEPGLSFDGPEFDLSDTEINEHSDTENVMEKVDVGLASQHLETSFHVPSSSKDYSVLDQQNRTFKMQTENPLPSHSMSKLQSVEACGMDRSYDSSQQSDVVVYDVSDDASSDTENEMIGNEGKGNIILASPRSKKNMDGYDHPRSVPSQKDSETVNNSTQFSSFIDDTKSHLNDAGGIGLNFGSLRGGLKNKRTTLPPYVNSTVDESLRSKISADDSSKQVSLEATTTAFDSARYSVHSRKSGFSPIEGSKTRSQDSSDSEGAEVDLDQHPARGSKSYYSAASPLSTGKSNDYLTIDKKEKALDFKKLESSEISREKSRRRSSGRTSKESIRASVADNADKDVDKGTISPTGHDASSIPFNQKLGSSETAVPSTTRMSRVAGIDGKKTSVRTSKGPISTAAFFDEENDEEVYKARDTSENLGIPSDTRLSRRRTKASVIGQLSSSQGSFEDSGTHFLRKKSLELTSSTPELSSKPSITRDKQETNMNSKFLPPDAPVERRRPSENKILAHKDRLSAHSVPESPSRSSTGSVEPETFRTSKFLPPNMLTERRSAKLSEDDVSVTRDAGPEPSQRNLSSDNQSQSLAAQTGVPANAETSKQSASRDKSHKESHVHPKLPDYETLAGYFKSLRSNQSQS